VVIADRSSLVAHRRQLSEGEHRAWRDRSRGAQLRQELNSESILIKVDHSRIGQGDNGSITQATA
jgi:hypothetical protein